jgi:hypothetical protein
VGVLGGKVNKYKQILDNECYNTGKRGSFKTLRREKMPDIFKALASVTAWALFIGGWGHSLSGFAQWAAGGFTTADWEPQAAFLAIGTVSFVLSVVVMRLRQKME